MIRKFDGRTPRIDKTAFVHDSAVIIGDVEIGPHASVWPNAVLRGDIEKITVGANTNVQDNAVLHTNHNLPLTVAQNVVIGHNANLHSCRVAEGALIGIGATVMDGAVVGEQAYVGAGALVPPGKEVPARMVMLGTPGVVTRPVSEDEIEGQKDLVKAYVEKAEAYKEKEEEI